MTPIPHSRRYATVLRIGVVACPVVYITCTRELKRSNKCQHRS